MKKYIVLIALFVFGCSKPSVFKQYPKVVKNQCGTFAVRIKPATYRSSKLLDTFLYAGINKPSQFGFFISGGYGYTSDDDSILILYSRLKSEYTTNVWKGDTTYDQLNGNEIQFKDSLSAAVALNSYLAKVKLEKKISDSFDNLSAKHRADTKAYFDSLSKCHTYN